MTGLGYTTDEPTRKGYTGYEKDAESSLEFAQARYYSTTHGRYTSVDPLTASASIRNPQTFNRYTYVLNSPYKFTDPLGLKPESLTGFRNRVINAINGGGTLSQADRELALFHIRNGTALGYAFLNAATEAINRPAPRPTTYQQLGGSTPYPTQSAPSRFGSAANSSSSTVQGSANTNLDNQFPEFSEIVKNYQNTNMGVDHGCAMRVSYALIRSGMDFSQYKGYMIEATIGGTKVKLAARAYELWDWLYDKATTKGSNAKGVWMKVDGPTSDMRSFFDGGQGIILFKDFWGNSQGHIDWWDGSGGNGSAVTSGPNSYFSRSKKVFLIRLD